MLYAILFAALSTPASAPAPGDTPVLTRVGNSGFSLISRAEACAIFHDRVEVHRTLVVPGLEPIHTETSYPFVLEGEVTAYIAAAAEGEQTSDIGPTDVPQLHYHAYRTVSAGQVEQLDLGSVLDSHITHNAALEAEALKELIDAHCPTLGKLWANISRL